MIKYKTRNWAPYIVEIEVMGETDHFVQISHTRREWKINQSGGYFDTLQEAKDSLISRYTTELRNARSWVRSVEDKLEEIRNFE